MSPPRSPSLAADLPLPGLLLGAYPERRLPSRRGWAQALEEFARWGTALAAGGAERYRPFVQRARARHAGVARLDGVALLEQARQVGAWLRRDGLRDELLAQALAVALQACRAQLGKEVYDEQILAARIVLDGRLAEMATGEGKTLALALAAAAAALAGIPVHLITANDYLVDRDTEALRPLYTALGLSVGAVTAPMKADERRLAYRCDIAYCTARELVFDYLRDRLAAPERNPLRWQLTRVAAPGRPPLLRGLCLALIDEADSILIDEARTPLVIAQPAPDGEENARLGFALELARGLEPGHYTIDTAAQSLALTPPGRAAVEAACAGRGGLWRNDFYRDHCVVQALTALHLLARDRQYLVRDGKVLIIDETTGRVAEGRSWSRGLHQLVELKEACRPTPRTTTATQITYQRFFPRYLRLGGMSGTLRESRGELAAVYGLCTVRVPLRRPSQRRALGTRVFADRDTLWREVALRARVVAASGRPVLIGTDSPVDSEQLSAQLTAAGVLHQVLNARHDRDEARIVAGAGEAGRVTVATNMAGRGTDIVLGPGVAARGGLHVICCQLNSARRIDRQLAGRGARQGDPGSVESMLSLDAGLAARYLPQGLRSLGGRLPARHQALRWLAAAPQRLEERRQQLQRRRLLAADADIDRRLAFGGRRE
jgi:preprotein translocase subunit SecA